MAKTIEISDELWQALQEIKKIISQLAQTEITKDEEVLEILIKGFIETVLQTPPQQWGPTQGESGIITE